MLPIIIYSISAIFAVLLLVCFVEPRCRWLYFDAVKGHAKKFWELYADKYAYWWDYLMAPVLIIFHVSFLLILFIFLMPIWVIINVIRDADLYDSFIEIDEEYAKKVKRNNTYFRYTNIAEYRAKCKAELEEYESTHFSVDINILDVEYTSSEIIFYSPKPNTEIENLILEHLDEIKEACGSFMFLFLPDLRNQLEELKNSGALEYYNPRSDRTEKQIPELLSYSDIKDALSIPDKVDGPCLLRREKFDTFEYCLLKVEDGQDIVDAFNVCLDKIRPHLKFYSIKTVEERLKGLEDVPSDDCFDEEVLLIGAEIKERIDKLRVKGLTSLAIKRLIGDDSDKPSRLLIDCHYRLILTDYGCREVKLEPLQKAVFFLFLRHPEGILFKNLMDYREEITLIYKKITGREDVSEVENSIRRLTNPLDNSINEKCARIKNAFVSEFREEVAQWYFIKGAKGEKKYIALPRELVKWEATI